MLETAFDWVLATADFNEDGKVSIDDIGSSLFEVFVLPGNAFVYGVENYIPQLAAAMNLPAGAYDGVTAIWAAVIIWLAVIVIAGTILNAIRDFLYRLRSRLSAYYRELTRVVRILRRRLRTAIGTRLNRGLDAGDSVIVDHIRLSSAENAVLRQLTRVEDGEVISIEQLAARIGCTAKAIEPILLRLVDLEMVESGKDRWSDRVGFRIVTAGQMYLLGA